MLMFSESEVIERFKDFSNEQLREISNSLRRALETNTFSSRRVSEDLLGLVNYEIERRSDIR